MKKPCIYIMTNRPGGTLYTGVSSDILRRRSEHEGKRSPSFTKRYNLDRLVYVEHHATMQEAIHREKCIKKWKREWKIRLIESTNPQWKDLLEDIVHTN